MGYDSLIPTLALFTLGAGLAAGLIQMVFFLRRRKNREAMKRGLMDQ